MRRQPFGGWKKSAVGPGTKAGGPQLPDRPGPLGDRAVNRLGRGHATLPYGACSTPDPAGLLTPDECDVVEARAPQRRRAPGSESFGLAADVSGLPVERNVLRYRPMPVTVRCGVRGAQADLLRVVAAGALAGAPMVVSTAAALVGPIRQAVAAVAQRFVEDETSWLHRAAAMESGRIRLIGESPARLAEAIGRRPDLAVWAHPVTEAGRVELLCFLREQAVSITAHRFGTPDHLSDDLL